MYTSQHSTKFDVYIYEHGVGTLAATAVPHAEAAAHLAEARIARVPGRHTRIVVSGRVYPLMHPHSLTFPRRRPLTCGPVERAKLLASLSKAGIIPEVVE